MRRVRTIFQSCLQALVLALVALPVCAQEQKPPAGEVRGVISSGLGELGLSQRFPDSVVWLDLDEGARTLALFWPEKKPPARGAVIILADEDENAESGLAGALARALSNRKLAVLSVGLEAPSAALEQVLETPQPEPGTSESGGAAGSSATIDVMTSEKSQDLVTAYRERIQAELSAAEAELTQREYKLAGVIGIGRGSNHVTPFAAGLNTPPALIWVGPGFYTRDARELAKTLKNAPSLRVLELSSSDASMQRKARLQRAGVAGIDIQPVGSGTVFLPRDGKALASRISSWLKADARGARQ